MHEHIADPKSYGIYIVDRRFIGLEETLQQLTNYMHDFVKLNRRQRIIQRNRTERLSELLDWRNLGIYYRQARVKALQTVFPDYVDESTNYLENRANFNYPRPLSAPPSPTSSRRSSVRGSDSEEDSIDEEQELHELGLKDHSN